LVAELAALGLEASYGAVWRFVHAEKLSVKKPCTPARRIVPMSRDGGRSGPPIRIRIDAFAERRG
jgi:hypothetical protein